MISKPLAYIFLPASNRHEYEVKMIRNIIKGYALSGIVWLRQPTEEEQLSMLPCIIPNGFELIAQPLQT